MDEQERLKWARYREKCRQQYERGMERVRTTPEPEGQKFACGSRVRIADDLGPWMWHFPSGVNATVVYCYDHAFEGGDTDSYCLDVDGEGKISWYKEWQLTAIEEE